MRITLTVYVGRQPEQSLDDLLQLPMAVASAFAETVNQEQLSFIKGFDVAYDTEASTADSKSKGVPYQLLNRLSEEQKSQ